MKVKYVALSKHKEQCDCCDAGEQFNWVPFFMILVKIERMCGCIYVDLREPKKCTIKLNISDKKTLVWTKKQLNE